ncbi:hypothetical protein [Microbacterium binotii]|uniref:hypothetical protein n=1 Tax=Microbacterium binotii TaxID=462710 RepID=UPI001F187321|nr:hypothetical protein [Microbacterium binotii]UIN31717.1 hypothetical protein LXM64_05890 [Microbacterium binotii]
MSTIQAPAPTGVRSTDTANLQSLIDQLAGVGGRIELQPGTYKITALAMPREYKLPHLVGQGIGVTVLESDGTGPAALSIEGHSGWHSGLVVSDFTIKSATGNGVGLRFWAICGAVARRLQFENLQVAGLFHNNALNDFTEFDLFEDCYFESTVLRALEYRISNGGAESFHGSGLKGKCIVNQPENAAYSSILIGAGTLPYNAPLEVTFFARTPNQPLIQNDSARLPMFYGVVRVEQFANNCILAAGPGGVVTLAGFVTALGQAALRLGALREVERAYWNNSGYQVEARANYARTVTAPSGGGFDLLSWGDKTVAGHALVVVDIIAANYHYSRLLFCWRSPYNPGGSVTELAAPFSLNNAGYGAPNFAMADYKLKVANPSYPAGMIADARVLSMPPSIFG